MSNEERPTHSTVFEGPIERGDTFHLPEIARSAEAEQSTLSDKFTLESDVFSEENISSIVLPKLLIGPTNAIKERSLLLLTFRANHKPSVYKEILNAAKNGIEKFIIRFIDENGSDTISTWHFTEVRVHAVDFGYVAEERTEQNSVSVEIDYKNIIIDDFEF